MLIMKNLENKFKEYISNQNDAPDDLVWTKIEQTLDKKRKRRFIFFWLFMIPVFSVLIYGVFKDNQKNPFIDQNEIEFNQTNRSVVNEKATETLNTKDNSAKDESNSHEVSPSGKPKSIKTSNSFNNKLSSDGSSDSEKSKNKSGRSKRTTNSKNSPSSINSSITTNSALVSDKEFMLETEKDSTRIAHSQYDNEQIIDSVSNLKEDQKKNDKIVKNEKTPDSTITQSEKKNKYHLGIFYAPTMSGSISGKSLINESFNSFDKEFAFSNSYGVYVRFKSNKMGLKLSLQYTELQQNTIIKSNQIGAFNYSNIDLYQNVSQADIASFIEQNNGAELIQTFKAIEIPIEFYYELINKKPIEIDAFGGISFVNLLDSKLQMQSNGNRLSIGNPSNSIAPIGLSLGLNGRVKLNKNYNFTISPMMRHYINFNNSVYTPTSFMIQTGIEYYFD